MFRTAELGRKVPKTEFKAREITLRQELLEAQQDLRNLGNKFPVILVFAGVDGAGKGETVNILNEWMDPRWLVTRAYGEPSDEERERPEYWRYWRDLPPNGQIGMFLSSWYSQPVLDRAYGLINEAEFDEKLDRVIAFENELAADGAIILKFWMHLGREAQKKRLKTLGKDPLLHWRVTEKDWQHWRMYDEFIDAAERTIMRTSTGEAPWSIVEGGDANYRSLTVGESLRDTLRKRIDAARLEAELKQQVKAAEIPAEPEAAQQEPASESVLTVLDTLDMSLHLTKQKYKKELKELQARLNLLHRRAREENVSAVLVFEGPDAAGKGGAIRRITAALDSRNYQVTPIAAPTDEERAHHYLWRFWRHVSRAGRFTLFDRSWYGRVLVERVEGFATEAEWRRAYAEINDFEEQLTQHGIVLLKFWVHISKDEQLARFKAREETPHKRWKLTDEDWRNREKWDDYALAVNDIVEHTSTRTAPWILVEGNDKLYARTKVIRSLCDALEKALTKKDDD